MNVFTAAAVVASCAALIGGLFTQSAHAATPSAEPKVQVMIVGVFHMSNPGADIHNAKFEDVLAPKHQADIERAVTGIARFKPTRVAVEWQAGRPERDYPAYLAGTLAPSRNEVVQLGFRLARTAGVKQVDGVDVDGDFPFGPVMDYAKAHGRQALLDSANAEVAAHIKMQEELVRTRGVTANLRYLNDPAEIARGHAFYRSLLRIGGGREQPGAELISAWYRRNALICANIVQLAKPGDRIVAFYGSGHAFMLRQCVQETPGFELVEANDYLPAS